MGRYRYYYLNIISGGYELCSIDICEANTRSLTAADRMYLIKHRVPKTNFSFPATSYADARRSKATKRYCKYSYFIDYEPLTYSYVEDAVYCLPCALFPPVKASNAPTNLVKKGYRNWKKVTDVIQHHLEDATGCHAFAVQRQKEFLSRNSDNPTQRTIEQELNKEYNEEVERNRIILHSVLKSLMFCGRQGLALRGHRDSGRLNVDCLYGEAPMDEVPISLSELPQQHNHGNFRSLLQFRVDSGDIVLKEHLTKCASNATYISSNIQNQLLEHLRHEILQHLQDDITSQNGKIMYSVLADEVTDNQNVSQLGVSIRYVDRKNTIKEMCIGFSALNSMTGESVAEEMIQAVSNIELDVKDTIGLGLDGAGNMSGWWPSLPYMICMLLFCI